MKPKKRQLKMMKLTDLDQKRRRRSLVAIGTIKPSLATVSNPKRVDLPLLSDMCLIELLMLSLVLKYELEYSI